MTNESSSIKKEEHVNAQTNKDEAKATPKFSVSPGLVGHTVVLCSSQRDKSNGIFTTLAKSGFRTFIAESVYDAVKMVSQELPHLVIIDSVLSDGNAGNVYDKIKAIPTLAHTPMLVRIVRKTRADLEPLAKKNFIGFVLGDVSPEDILAKVKSILESLGNLSPYFVKSDESKIKNSLNFSIKCEVVGKTDSNIIIKSPSEINPMSFVTVVPQNSTLASFSAKVSANLKREDRFYTLCSLNSCFGPGRDWLATLPEMQLQENNVQKKEATNKRLILFFDPNEKRLEEFKQVLASYNLHILPAKNLSTAVSNLKSHLKVIACIYMHELVMDSSTMEWRSTFEGLDSKIRPPLIVATSSVNPKSQFPINYINRPFGLGTFIELIEALISKPDVVNNFVSQNSKTAIPAIMQWDAQLLGIDEVGGILEAETPVPTGAQIALQHDFLNSTLGDDPSIKIENVSPVPNQCGLWYLRFNSVSAGHSKSKYWERIEHNLQDWAKKKTGS